MPSAAILLFKQSRLNYLAGALKILLFIISLAAIWHVGLAVLERRLCSKRGGPSLAKLLLLAEVEILRTLRAELRRRRLFENGESDREISRVEERLKEIGQDGT